MILRKISYRVRRSACPRFRCAAGANVDHEFRVERAAELWFGLDCGEVLGELAAGLGGFARVLLDLEAEPD